MTKEKGVADILPIIREMVVAGIWTNEEEAVGEFKLQREGQMMG